MYSRVVCGKVKRDALQVKMALRLIHPPARRLENLNDIVNIIIQKRGYFCITHRAKEIPKRTTGYRQYCKHGER